MTRWLAPSAVLASLLVAAGCHQPTVWSYTGPRVYLIEGTPQEAGDGLAEIRDALHARQINAEVFTPDNWLKIVIDIDARPHEDAILVGHGHGAFLCTQVVRHYAQEHKTKFIKAVLTVDAFNKDWPHSDRVRSEKPDRIPAEPIPIGHNARLVWNHLQWNPQSDRWGTELVSTRASNVAEEHPYYWYDNYWYERPVIGQVLRKNWTDSGVDHETIDNHAALVEKIMKICRQQALSPFHYTPVEHHPYAPATRSAPPHRPPEGRATRD
jgi:hypothetical protein